MVKHSNAINQNVQRLMCSLFEVPPCSAILCNVSVKVLNELERSAASKETT